MSDIPEALRQRLRALKTPTLRVERITREMLTDDGPGRVSWIVSAATHQDAGVSVHSITDLRWHVQLRLDLAAEECLRAARHRRTHSADFPAQSAHFIAIAEQYERDADALIAVSREFETLWPVTT